MAAQFHIGTFFLFVAFVLLLIVSVSAPVWKDLGFMKVTVLPNSSEGTRALFGVFGYCVKGAGINQCSKAGIGYRLGDIVRGLDHTNFRSSTLSTLHGLTGALILHPIAAGLTFLALLTALGAHRIGFVCSSFIAFLAWIVTLLALILDFVMFDIVKRNVNNSKLSGSKAQWSSAIWLVLSAFIILFFGSITICCGCLTDRRNSRRSY